MRGIPERPDAERQLRAAQRLAWLSIAYICSTVALLFMVMGGSQAMKTEFVEDALSFLPPAFFLISDKISRREPNRRFPFGYERVVSAAYVGSAVALLAVGLLLLFDGGMKLAMAEHPTIGGFPSLGTSSGLDGWRFQCSCGARSRHISSAAPSARQRASFTTRP